MESNNNNNRTSGDGQSSPDLTDRKYTSQDYEHQTMATETFESSIMGTERDFSRQQRKFFYLIDKVKKRKLKLRHLRSRLDINYDDGNDSEFEGFEEMSICQAPPANSIINQYETTQNNDETNFNSKIVRPNDTINTSTGTYSEKIKQFVRIIRF